MTNHAVYSKEIEKVLPKKDTIYITLLRSIPDMYRSIYRYFHDAIPGYKKTPNTIEGFAKFAKNPKNYTDFLFRDKVFDWQEKDTYQLKQQGLWFFFRNTAMYDLGYPEFAREKNATDDHDRVRKAVREITSRFDEILITEHMDEGLILLADRLCWTVEDIVEFRQNIEIQKDDKSLITKDAEKALKEFNSADNELYNVAYHMFKEKVKKFGRKRMDEKLQELRLLRMKLLDRCTVDRRPFPAAELKDGHHMIVSPPGIVIGGWKLKNDSDTYE